MKNTKARDNSGDDWKTPDWFYDKLNDGIIVKRLKNREKLSMCVRWNNEVSVLFL